MQLSKGIGECSWAMELGEREFGKGCGTRSLRTEIGMALGNEFLRKEFGAVG